MTTRLRSKRARPLPARIDPARLEQRRRLSSRRSGKKPSSTKAPISAGERMPRGRLDARELRAGVHVDHGAGEHAELAHPVEGPARASASGPSPG